MDFIGFQEEFINDDDRYVDTRTDKLLAFSKEISAASDRLSESAENLTIAIKREEEWEEKKLYNALLRNMKSAWNSVLEMSPLIRRSHTHDFSAISPEMRKTTVITGPFYVKASFPCRLPQKRAVEDIPGFHEAYRKPLYDAFSRYMDEEEGFPRIRKGKAIIVIRSIYADGTAHVDNDNLYTTDLVNVISDAFLVDDSPERCAIFLDYAAGEEDRTDAFVMRECDFVRFLTEPPA